jgi:hypothetical protein
MVGKMTVRARLANISASGAEEYEPEHAKDKDRQSGGSQQKGEYGRPGLGLPRFVWGFDDLTLSSRCHAASISCTGAPTHRCGAR